jgi:hypothetical protein
MRPAPVYRNIGRTQELFGLELEDLLGVGIVAAVMMVAQTPLPYAIGGLVSLYVFVRLFKRGKPAGYSRSLLRYTARPAVLCGSAPDRHGRARRFLSTSSKESSHE